LAGLLLSFQTPNYSRRAWKLVEIKIRIIMIMERMTMPIFFPCVVTIYS